MDFTELRKIKRRLEKEPKVKLLLPHTFSFKRQGINSFDTLLSWFDWNLYNRQVVIDFTHCKSPNYQALSLIVTYIWKLRMQGCRITIELDNELGGASAMWKRMGAHEFIQVLDNEDLNFISHDMQPLFAIRNNKDFNQVLAKTESYIKDVDAEYLKTLRYIISELLYNTMEHGSGIKDIIPSMTQFSWYQKADELQFIIADCGIGIKKHLEQTYPGYDTHADAIKDAIKPQVSGTFNVTNEYKAKNNAGMGMFISTNIIKRLNADIHILSMDGLVHVSPRDITSKILKHKWPGTIVLVTIKLDKNTDFILTKAMQEFREVAVEEQMKADNAEKEDIFYININNHFGPYAEDKSAAIKFRDKKLFPKIKQGKNIKIDFSGVETAPHSFLSALLASPIKTMSMTAYKRLKIVSASSDIRETIDFIFDDNT
ncbi:MAG: hypothetical protein DRG78_05720 [Epsilonproteobacteria bacterium]|nr:MAG: hypothetical protein DRG78_05720 [Campylobacterota bacterium]